MEPNDRSKKYINPYLGGVLLGLLLLFTIYFTGRGLGASGAVKNVVVASVNEISSAHVQQNAYYSQFISDDVNPLNNWLVFEIIGVLVGAFISGALAGRLKWKVEHQPKITSRTRLIFAATGGAIFGFGSQFARGCTSGAALSGTAVLSAAGLLTMMMIFGTGYALAWAFKKLWL
jgi:uncharacterized membrane protein YedE/YeeE